jgi:hypothetical protein
MMNYLLPTHNTLWRFAAGVTPNQIGFIPDWFRNGDDVPPAQEQANAGYMQTGACPYTPTSVEFKLVRRGDVYELQYPEDPPYKEMARTTIGDETVVVFEMAWVAIIQPDESFVVAHCD